MDTRHFDGIVRNLNAAGSRRDALIALAAGGLSLGFLRAEDADAKKKHKRKKNKKKRKNKRCLTLGSICNPGGKRRCCGDLSCEVRTGNTQADCCIELGGICETAADCCEGGCIPNLLGSTEKHCRILT
jgi:hypothetical protein